MLSADIEQYAKSSQQTNKISQAQFFNRHFEIKTVSLILNVLVKT